MEAAEGGGGPGVALVVFVRGLAVRAGGEVGEHLRSVLIAGEAHKAWRRWLERG